MPSEDAAAPQRNVSAGGGAVRVMVVEPHELMRSAICALVRSERRLVLVAAARDLAESMSSPAVDAAPDVILLDHRTSWADLPSSVRVVRRQFPSSAILLTGTSLDAGHHVAALRAGASGYVSVLASAEDLTASIAEAATDSARQ